MKKAALAAQLDEIRKAEQKCKGSYRTETSAQADAQKNDISVEDLESMISKED